MIYTASVYSYNEMKLDLDPIEDIVINEQELIALNEISIGEIFKKIIDWIKARFHDFIDWIKKIRIKNKASEIKVKAMAAKADNIEVGDDVNSEESSSFKTFKPDTFKPDTFEPETFKPDTFEPETFKPDGFESEDKEESKRKSVVKYKFSKKSALQHGYDLYKSTHKNIIMDAIPHSNEIYGDEDYIDFFKKDIEDVFKDIINDSNESIDDYLLKDEIGEEECYRSLVVSSLRVHTEFIKRHNLYSEFFNGLRLKNAKELLNRINGTSGYTKKMFYYKIEDCPTVEELKTSSFFKKEIEYATKYINESVKMYKDLENNISQIQRNIITDINKLDTKKQNLVYRLVSRITIIVQNSVSFTTAMAGVVDTYVSNIYNKLYPEVIRSYVKYGKQNSVDEEKLEFRNLKPEGYLSYNESSSIENNKSLFESVCLL